MGVFGNIFGSSLNEMSSFWHKIECDADLDSAIQNSYSYQVIIFKHSVRCFISKAVLKNFEKEIENASDAETQFYYLDLLAHRNISRRIAEELGVEHQSPQIVVIKDGIATYNASHQDISLNTIL